MMARILVITFVGIVILAECMLAYFLIPSADDVATAAKEKIAKEVEESQTAEDPTEAAKDDEDVVEIDLGRFNITLHQHTANATLHINLHLIGTVATKNESDFMTLFENNQHRFRDKVLSEIRNSELTDLSEPPLGLIKRRILAKSNTLFGKPYLTSIVLSEFTYHQQ